jgi:hypothetical protein
MNYDSPVLDYEAPALAILGGKSRPDAFAVYSAALSFPEPSKPGLVPVMVEIPAGSINFLVDKDKTKYRADFSVVVLIKDQSQRVVKKLSTHYLLGGPYQQLDSALNGNILFYRETQLEPGAYSIDSVVYDALAKQAATKGGSVVVPGGDKEQLRLSSIVFVKTAEHVSAAFKPASTLFHFGEALLYPNLGEPISIANYGQELPFFLTIYSARDTKTAPNMDLKVFQGARIVSQSFASLPAADETGRIQFSGTLPLDKFTPGEYELRATVSDGKTQAVRVEHFTIQP